MEIVCLYPKLRHHRCYSSLSYLSNISFDFLKLFRKLFIDTVGLIFELITWKNIDLQCEQEG